MRHLLSVVLSLVLAPLIYLAAGFSAIKLGDATSLSGIEWGAALAGLGGAAVAGSGYALLVMARLSPVGPVLVGLLYLGVTLWSLLDGAGFVSAMPDSLFGTDGVFTAPIGAGTILLAVPLLATILSPRRWRSSANVGYDPSNAAPIYPTSVGSAAPTYGDMPATPSYVSPVYIPPASAAPIFDPPAPLAPSSTEPQPPAR